MIDNSGITLNDSIYSQVASIASIGDLTIFQNLDSDLDSVKSGSASTQNHHGSFRSTARVSGQKMDEIWLTYSLQAWR